MSDQRIAYFDGRFIPEENAKLHISDLSIQRGYGAFDFFRVVNNVPVFMDEHLDRFYRSAAGLKLEIGIDKASLRSIITELIGRNNMASSGIKLTITGGYSPDGFSMIAPNFFITQQHVPPRLEEWVEKGLKVITYEHVREQPEIKSINYITGVLLHEKIKKTGAHDVLYVQNNEVSEFPRFNFFIVTKDDVIATPAKNVLHGITRARVLDLASKQFKTAERAVTVNDIRNAKEAFITSTTKQVLPVVQVDDIIIGNGKPGFVTRQLDAQMQEVIKSLVIESLVDT